MELNQKLLELRKGRGLTQQELAEALNVSRQTVSRWEVGTAAPSLDNLMFLSRLYGVPLDGFIQDENTDMGTEKPSNAPVSLEPVPVSADRPHVILTSAFLAVLILGVGILIGLGLRREAPKEMRPQITENSQITVGWLEKTPTDIEDELQWLETAVKDLLEEDQPLP